MAVGDVINASNAKRSINLATTLTATAAVPTLATQGVENYPDPVASVYGSADRGACYAASAAQASTIMIDASGGPSATFVLYGYLKASGAWYPIKALNGAAAVTANYAEVVPHLGHYDRLYLAATVTTGTFNAWLTTARAVMF